MRLARTLFVVVAGLALVAAVPSAQAAKAKKEKEHNVKGVVTAVDADGKTIKITIPAKTNKKTNVTTQAEDKTFKRVGQDHVHQGGRQEARGEGRTGCTGRREGGPEGEPPGQGRRGPGSEVPREEGQEEETSKRQTSGSGIASRSRGREVHRLPAAASGVFHRRTSVLQSPPGSYSSTSSTNISAPFGSRNWISSTRSPLRGFGSALKITIPPAHSPVFRGFTSTVCTPF